MKDTVHIIINYVISFLGFLATLGVVIGFPTSLVLLIMGLNEKNPQKKKNRLRWASILGLGPIGLIVVVLASFAVVNAII